MNDLKRSLSEAAAAAFQAAGLPPEFGRVTASDRPDLADFQCNGALAAAKSARHEQNRSGFRVLKFNDNSAHVPTVNRSGRSTIARISPGGKRSRSKARPNVVALQFRV